MVEQLTSLREWFLPDRPGPLVGLHIIQTGNGAAWADRWPKPRAVVVDAAGNQSLCGDPEALAPAAVRGPVGGFVEAPERFAPLLHAAFPDLREWQRVVFVLDGEPRRPELRGRGQGMVRRLRTADAAAVGALSDQSLWISKTWGGAAGLRAGRPRRRTAPASGWPTSSDSGWSATTGCSSSGSRSPGRLQTRPAAATGKPSRLATPAIPAAGRRCPCPWAVPIAGAHEVAGHFIDRDLPDRGGARRRRRQPAR